MRIQHSRESWNRRFRFVLFVLLFVTQQVALAVHPYDHDASTGATDCHICAVARLSADLSSIPALIERDGYTVLNEPFAELEIRFVAVRRTPIRAPPFITR